MATITWNATVKRFCIEFEGHDNRDALKAAIKATPEASIWRYESEEAVPVDPSPENIVVLWVSDYNWTDAAAREAFRRVMPMVQRQLFLDPK